jgi:mRNA interferase MazF
MRQGEIWMINLDPTIGAEIKKTRPAVIVKVRSVSQERFVNKLGNVSTIIMGEIRIGLSKVLSIDI